MEHIKKVIVVGMLLIGLGVTAAEYCPYAVRVAINKYKNHDYVGCIQDLEDYTSHDPSNAIAFYYSGIAYMKVGMKDKAVNAFEKVASINTVPILSSYAIQATNCMNSGITPCVYKKYTKNEINEMVEDPGAFFAKKDAEPQGEEQSQVDEGDVDIDKLIHGAYPDNIHPDANRTIQETRLLQEQEKVNAELNKKNKSTKTKSDATEQININERIAAVSPSDKEIADAVRTLNKAGYKFVAPTNETIGGGVNTQTQTTVAAKNENNAVKKDTTNQSEYNPYKQMAEYYANNSEAAQMAMMFGGNNNNRGSFDMMLPYMLMQQEQQNADGTNKKKIDPELIKTMMMNQMMDSFYGGFDYNSNKR